MENAIPASGLVGRSARLAHTFVREQLATLLAPGYLIAQSRRTRRAAASADHGSSQTAVVHVGVHASASTRS